MAGSKGFVPDLAAAILDGTPIDWADVEAETDPAARPIIEHLKVLAALADVHRATDPPAALPSVSPASRRAWGHVHLLQRIGHGAFGEVYRAWDTRLDREVALKLLPVEPPATGVPTSSIIQEGRLLARVRHPNVVTIHGAEQIGDRIGLWMEFVHGQTLEDLLRTGTTFSAADVMRIGHDLCRAVQAVHDAGVLHRDIKAQNVMLDDEGRVVLMDFGTGREAAGGATDLAGTPLYLAPEIFRGEDATAVSDVYSLGVLLYHLLTGSYPVHAVTLAELRRSHELGVRASLRAVLPALPSSLVSIVERALDPQPQRRYQSADALASDLVALSNPRHRSWPGYTALAAALATTLVWFAWPEREPVIAVLPFQNLSAEAGTDAVADGLTNELISSLAGIEGLRVSAPTSSFAFKNQPRDIAGAGARLRADLVLDASMVASQRGLRINARLVRLADDVTVWADTFDREAADVVTIQDDLALAIVNGLRLKLGRGQRRYEIDPDLYYQFLKARGLQARRQPLFAAEAVNEFEQIIARDPSFAPAVAGLARSLGDLWRLTRAGEMRALDPRLEEAALEAIRLDPLLAEAQSAMGILYARSRDWPNAEASFLRAIELNRSLTSIHTDFVLTVLLPLGRLDDGLALLETARALDPLSLDVPRTLAHLQVEAGRYEEAIQTSRWVLDRDPTFPFADLWLGRALVLSGRPQEARPIFEANPLSWAYLGYLFAVTGEREKAEALAAHHPEAPDTQMLIYGGLGDKERAFEALERAVVSNPWRAATWMRRPEVTLLREDPRFAAFRKRLGMPTESPEANLRVPR